MTGEIPLPKRLETLDEVTEPDIEIVDRRSPNYSGTVTPAPYGRDGSTGVETPRVVYPSSGTPDYVSSSSSSSSSSSVSPANVPLPYGYDGSLATPPRSPDEGSFLF